MNIIKEWRAKYGFTQEVGAVILEVHRLTLSKWERKENSDIPPEMFRMLCLLVGGKYYDFCYIEGIDNDGEPSPDFSRNSGLKYESATYKN